MFSRYSKRNKSNAKEKQAPAKNVKGSHVTVLKNKTVEPANRMQALVGAVEVTIVHITQQPNYKDLPLKKKAYEDVDGNDAVTFKADFGRNPLNIPCPPIL